MAKSKKYLIENTTVKPPRVDPKTGRDARSQTEVNGHVVSFRDNNDKPHLLHPSRPPAIVSELNEGIISLARGGFVRIKEIDDVVQALKAHTLHNEPVAARPVTAKKAQSELPAQTEAPQSDEDAAPQEGEEESSRRVRAVEMGQDDYAQRNGAEMDGAVNPDGDPNFLVRAPRGGQGRKRRGQESGE